MKKLIRKIASWAGVSTSYHVAGTYNIDSHMGHAIISLTVNVSPWIHVDNYKEIVAYVKTQTAGRIVGDPSITSITKLGA